MPTDTNHRAALQRVVRVDNDAASTCTLGEPTDANQDAWFEPSDVGDVLHHEDGVSAGSGKDALALRSSVPQLVAAFEAAEANVRAAYAMLVRTEETLNQLFTLGQSNDRIRIDASGGHWRSNFKDPDATIERMRREGWSIIVDRLEIRRAMSISRWTALEQERKHAKPEPITMSTVQAFVARYEADLPTMLREAVSEVFDFLRPRHGAPSAEYVTNQKNARIEIGERVIITWAVAAKTSLGSGFEVNDYSRQRLLALENLFRMLDGAGVRPTGYYSDLETAIRESGATKGHGATPYFEFRAHKNGNLHLRFLRLDLLARFNQLAGDGLLRPSPEPACEDEAQSA
jgi:hypothetical protein